MQLYVTMQQYIIIMTPVKYNEFMYTRGYSTYNSDDHVCVCVGGGGGGGGGIVRPSQLIVHQKGNTIIVWERSALLSIIILCIQWIIFGGKLCSIKQILVMFDTRPSKSLRHFNVDYNYESLSANPCNTTRQYILNIQHYLWKRYN